MKAKYKLVEVDAFETIQDLEDELNRLGEKGFSFRTKFAARAEDTGIPFHIMVFENAEDA